MREDQARQEGQIADQSLMEGATTQGTGKALQVGFRLGGELRAGADAHGGEASSMNDFLRRVGADVAHSLTLRIAFGPGAVRGFIGSDEDIEDGFHLFAIIT